MCTARRLLSTLLRSSAATTGTVMYTLIRCRRAVSSTNPPTQLSTMGYHIRVAGAKAKMRVLDDDRQSSQKIMTDRLTYRPFRLRSPGLPKRRSRLQILLQVHKKTNSRDRRGQVETGRCGGRQETSQSSTLTILLTSRRML